MTEITKQDGATLVAAIVQIKGAMQKLMSSGLNKKAVIVLIQDRTRLNKKDIEKVLDTLCGLEKWYTIHK